MRAELMSIVPQNYYLLETQQMNDAVRAHMKSVPPAELAKYKAFKNRPTTDAQAEAELAERMEKARELVRVRKRILEKAGVSTSLGYNFYDLRGPAYLLYPVNTPFRNSLARMGRVNDGVGTAANWKGTRNVGTSYLGAVEGQRVAVATPDEVNYVATYKEGGIERSNTFTSQFAGEGYTDNVADEHIRGLHQYWLQEESIMIMGNSGTASGNNGYQLGTMNTPVAALVAGTGLPDSTKVSAFCVAITALGVPRNNQYGYNTIPTVASGLTPSYVRTNADGSTTQINCGTSAISAASNIVTTGGGSNMVTFTATPKIGAYYYAWYVDITDASVPSKANALLAGITSFPTFTISANPSGTQNAAAAGLSTDFSANPYDFDGLMTYSAAQGYFVNGAGANLTKGVGGSVVELDTDLQFLWDNYQAQPQAIWCSSDAKQAIDNTILASTNGLSSFRFSYDRDSQGNLLGGFVISAYKSKFTMNPTGGDALPLRIHPMLPKGTIYYDISENPYPHSRVPFVRGMLVQRDYYSIEWPLTTRSWSFGTYCHEVLAHTMPWISAVRTGIGGAGS